MSLSVGSMAHETPADGSTLVIAGMLAIAIFFVALSAMLGVGSPSAAAMIVGP